MIFRDSGFGFNLSGLNYIYILLIGVSDLGGGGLNYRANRMQSSLLELAEVQPIMTINYRANRMQSSLLELLRCIR